jgi:CubicO group peptidase (beta-lactamase class C family)
MGRFLDKRTPAMMKNGTKRADEFLPVLMQEELLYPPGTKQGYSNSGFVLAGAIVEKVSGVDYPVYLQKYIFEPSGMVNSHPNHMPQSLPNLVTPYTGFGKDARVAEADLGSPAGGAISTADDLVRFADALRSGKLVSKETLAKMKMSRSPERDGSGYGYGMYNRKFYGLTMVGHGGGTAGVRTHLALFLDAPYTIVVLENVDLPVDFSWNAKAIMAAKARGDK